MKGDKFKRLLCNREELKLVGGDGKEEDLLSLISCAICEELLTPGVRVPRPVYCNLCMNAVYCEPCFK